MSVLHPESLGCEDVKYSPVVRQLVSSAPVEWASHHLIQWSSHHLIQWSAHGMHVGRGDPTGSKGHK